MTITCGLRLSLMGNSEGGGTMALGFYFDMNACTGCHTCQVACKDVNDLMAGTNFRTVRSFESGAYPDARLYNYSGACNHCEKPACVANCPTGAMYISEDGTVLHQDDVCIGCKTCVNSCPYGAPQYIEDLKIVKKCDSCIKFRNAGQEPTCVSSCLMRCLEFGDLDELKERHGDALVNELPMLPSADMTNPSILIDPKECAKQDDFEEIIL